MTPVVSETSVLLRLSHSLEILPHGSIELIGNQLSVSSVLWVLLSIQEPVGNLVLTRVLHNGDDFLNLLFAQLTSALVKINVSLEFQIKIST